MTPTPREIIWTISARQDLHDIHCFISRDSAPAANRMIARIFERPQILVVQPQLGRVVPEFGEESLREVFEGAYRIVYEFDDMAVYILRVSHHARLMRL